VFRQQRQLGDIVLGGQRFADQCRADAGAEARVAVLEIRPPLGSQRTEPVGDEAGDAYAVERVEQVVRVAERVDIAVRAVDGARRHFHRHDGLRRIDKPRLAGQQLRVARLPEQQRRVAGLELEPHLYEGIGLVQQGDETRARLDEVGVLGAFGEAADRDRIAPHGLGEAAEVRDGGADLQRRRRSHLVGRCAVGNCCRDAEDHRRQCEGVADGKTRCGCSAHDGPSSQYLWAACAPKKISPANQTECASTSGRWIALS